MQRHHGIRSGRGARALVAALLVGSGVCLAGQQADEAPEAAFRGHVFRNHFWVNLHHFLYLQGVTAERQGEVAEAPQEWMDAVELYRSSLISRDLLFDPGMRAIDERLGRVSLRSELDALELPEGLAGALRAAAPLYLSRFWVEHERANAAWIAAVRPLLEEHGGEVMRRLSDVLVSQSPSPVLVDVLAYANWAGAYTSSGPDHVRIASLYPRAERPAEAFETLLHETSHLMVDTLADRIERAARDAGVRAPRDLWHVILFFTCGELARRSAATPEDYRPYAERHGLYERSPQWGICRDVLAEHWLPYLDGEQTMDAALEKIVPAAAERIEEALRERAQAK